jgi:hypothetical protein
MTSLLIPAEDERLEAIYGWLEGHPGARAQLWARESDRRFALLAYSDGADDAFGWSNWTTKAYEDPSELIRLFEQVEIVVEADIGTALQAAFPGALQPGEGDGE